MPESADWYNSGFLILWGSNVPQTRTPDAHFYTEVRYKGAKSVVICPDYSEASKFADMWISREAGHRRGAGHGHGPRDPAEFHVDRQAQYFEDYARQYTDMPMLVRLVKQGDHLVPDRLLRASDFAGDLGETNNPEWKTVAFDETSGKHCRAQRLGRLPLGREGQVEPGGEGDADGRETKLQLTLRRRQGRVRRRRLSLLRQPRARPLRRHRPPERAGAQRSGQARAARRTARRWLRRCSTCSSPTTASTAASAAPTSPSPTTRTCPTRRRGPRSITGVPRDQIIQVAREFARNAEKTNGRSMIIIGAAMNHWFHCDMNYRGVINMLVMCGCVGQSGGGWSHYVGQEKLRPQIGLAAARLRARLGPPAAAAELHLVLLRPHRPVALRDARCRRDRLAHCAGWAAGMGR